MGSERHIRATLFPLHSAGHRCHPFLSRTYSQNNHHTNNARRPLNFEWTRPNCSSQCLVLKVNPQLRISPPISDTLCVEKHKQL